MLLSVIIENIETFAPIGLAEAWDNVGLMVGDPDMEIKKAVVVLDVTENVIDFAIYNGCELIISHHPFIMSLGKNMALDNHLNKMIYKLIKNDIAVYSMHTNFDSCTGGVNTVICEKLGLLGYETDEPCTIMSGRLPEEKTLSEFIDMVKEAFSVSCVSYSGNLDKKINTVAVCGGSGGSFLDMARDADVYLTGEAKYHDFQHALSINLPLVTAGHFETENPSLYKIRDMLSAMNITVLNPDIHNGFSKLR